MTTKRSGVAVINTTTGVQYSSLSAAAESQGASISALFASIKNGHRFKGAYWERIDGKNAPRKPRVARRVVNCYTGEVFRSTVEAAASIGVRETCLRNCIGRGSLCKGTYWDWLELNIKAKNED